MKKKLLGTGLVTVLAVLGIIPLPVAQADPSLADKSIATQLFKEGRVLLDQGRVPQACRKLEESQRLEPGGGTLLNLALCHEREGRTATAWVEFTEALGVAKRDDRPQRVEFARAHLATLEPTLSRLVIQVSSTADLPDLEIKRDGSTVGRAAWGSPIPIDPGDHVVEASASGKIPWKQLVVVGAKADLRSIVVPQLDSAPVADEGAAPAPHASPPGASLPPADVPEQATAPEPIVPSERPGGGGGISVPGWISMGVGAVGIAVGSYFAVRAISQKSDADRECQNDLCTADGAQQNAGAIQSANVATVGFGVGLAGLAIGTVLLITHAGAHASAPAHTAAAELNAVSIGPDGAKVNATWQW